MKTLILMPNAAIRDDGSTSPELVPLSVDGVMEANRIFKNPIFEDVTQVWSSTWRRAYETAMILSGGVTLDNRLDDAQQINSFACAILERMQDGDCALALATDDVINSFTEHMNHSEPLGNAIVLRYEANSLAEISHIA